MKMLNYYLLNFQIKMYVFNLKCIFTDTNYVMIIVYRYNIFTRVIIYNLKLICRKKKHNNINNK